MKKDKNDCFINESGILLRTLEDKKIFIDAILNPTAPNEALKKAQKKYRQKKSESRISW